MLTGRERTIRALEFETVDRVPVVGGFVRHPPFLAAAAGTTVDGFWADPQGFAIRAFRNLGVDCIIGLILPSPDSATGAQVGMHQPSRFDSPEAMNRFFEHSGERAYLQNVGHARAIIEHDLPRVIWAGQDACHNRGPYIAPETMNEIYIRHVKRSLEPLKEIGVKVLWHADGNIAPIVPYLLDAGVDGFQGLQETIETRVDVPKLRNMITRAGKPPVVVGSVSSVSTMPFGAPDDVRADVRRCKKLAAAKGGGWLLNFSSSLGPECPAENIQTFFEEAVEGNGLA